MKPFAFILSLIFCVFLYACTKETTASKTAPNKPKVTAAASDTTKLSSVSIAGKWKLSATYNDIGNGVVNWVPVPEKADYDYIKFDTDGKLEGTAFPGYLNFTIKDSVTVTFTGIDKTAQNYRAVFKNDSLVMSPAGPIFCTEGCGVKFAKVN